MVKPNSRRPPSSRTNLASCVVATIFLIFILVVLFVVYFTVFKPRDPKISVNAVQLPSFATSNNTANFTFSQYVAVRNPNRAVFTHYDSSIQLLYSGRQVGFMFIPAGKIDSGRIQYMAATFTVNSFSLSPPPSSIPSITAVSAASDISGPPINPGFPGFQGNPDSPGFQNPGFPGFQGNPGDPGSAGFQGNPGMPGYQGNPGSPVNPGPGFQGNPGDPGSSGFQGDPGMPGFQGNPGSPVNQGPGILGPPAMPGSPPAGVGEWGPNVGDGHAAPGLGHGNRIGPTLEIESKMELVGRIRVLNVFTHHVVAKSGCRVTVAVADGSVMGFHC